MDKTQAMSRVNAEFSRFFEEPRQRYSNVTFIALLWKDSDSGYLAEAKRLEELFKQTFNFSTDIFEIPTANSQEELKRVITQLVQDITQADSLLIIHYGGHGALDPCNGDHEASNPCNGHRSVWAA